MSKNRNSVFEDNNLENLKTSTEKKLKHRDTINKLDNKEEHPKRTKSKLDNIEEHSKRSTDSLNVLTEADFIRTKIPATTNDL
jgi:hypothetical protein